MLRNGAKTSEQKRAQFARPLDDERFRVRSPYVPAADANAPEWRTLSEKGFAVIWARRLTPLLVLILIAGLSYFRRHPYPLPTKFGHHATSPLDLVNEPGESLNVVSRLAPWSEWVRGPDGSMYAFQEAFHEFVEGHGTVFASVGDLLGAAVLVRVSWGFPNPRIEPVVWLTKRESGGPGPSSAPRPRLEIRGRQLLVHDADKGIPVMDIASGEVFSTEVSRPPLRP